MKSITCFLQLQREANDKYTLAKIVTALIPNFKIVSLLESNKEHGDVIYCEIRGQLITLRPNPLQLIHCFYYV